MNYALDTSAGTNVTVIIPAELLELQNKICAACENRDKCRSGLPKAIAEGLLEAFDLQVVIPLVHPSDLHVVRDRRQHIINFALGPRSNRPNDLYFDPSIETSSQNRQVITPAPLRIATERRQPRFSQTSKCSSELDSKDGAYPAFHSDDVDGSTIGSLTHRYHNDSEENLGIIAMLKEVLMSLTLEG